MKTKDSQRPEQTTGKAPDKTSPQPPAPQPPLCEEEFNAEQISAGILQPLSSQC